MPGTPSFQRNLFLINLTQAMSKQLQCYDLIRKSQLADRAHSPDQEWEDWIFEESERRLAHGRSIKPNDRRILIDL
jgi:hypothetical protein